MALISALPFTLTNGTLADAIEVMADLNHIRTQVNTNATTTPVAVMPIDVSLTNTGADVDILAVSLDALTTYSVELWANLWCTTPPGGLDFQFRLHTTGVIADGLFSYEALDAVAMGSSYSSQNVLWNLPFFVTPVTSLLYTGSGWLKLTGYVKTTTAGQLVFNFKPIMPQATTLIVGKGSWLKCTKLA